MWISGVCAALFWFRLPGSFAHLRRSKRSSSCKPSFNVCYQTRREGVGGCLECRVSINCAHTTPLSLFLIWSNRREKFDLVAACAFKTSCSLLFVSVSRLVSPSPSTQTQRKAHPRLRRRTLSQKQTCHAKTESSYLHLCFAVLMNVRMFFHQHPVR